MLGYDVHEHAHGKRLHLGTKNKAEVCSHQKAL